MAERLAQSTNRPTDRAVPAREEEGEGKGESAPMRLQNANTPPVNEWWVGCRAGRTYGCMDG